MSFSAQPPPSNGCADCWTAWRCCGVCVHCDPAVAAGRELARGDRVPGMAEAQAHLVHPGVAYDIEVDTSHTEAITCAHAIAAHLT
jgi:chloramphenicol 3-O phosphotransferase